MEEVKEVGRVEMNAPLAKTARTIILWEYDVAGDTVAVTLPHLGVNVLPRTARSPPAVN